MRPYRGKYPKLLKLDVGEATVISLPKGTAITTQRQSMGNVVNNINRTRGVYLRWRVTNHVTGEITVRRCLPVDEALAALGQLRKI